MSLAGSAGENRFVSRVTPSAGTAFSQLCANVQRRLAREGAKRLFKRLIPIHTDTPIISFTFDDFPRSALFEGGTILGRYGIAATYYASLGLAGKYGPPGAMFLLEDLQRVLDRGHELGCHTFAHCHSRDTRPHDFESSVIKNRLELRRVLPGASFRTLAYPKSVPRPGTKRRMAEYFVCCRGGGDTLNSGIADLNFLRAFFLERANDPGQVNQLIDRNRRKRGWLIFATHDVCQSPSPYGCTPDYFESVVRHAVDSGAQLMPVGRAYDKLSGLM